MRITILDKINAQKEFCKKNGLVFVADILSCPYCKADVYENIGIDYCKNNHISKCFDCDRIFMVKQ